MSFERGELFYTGKAKKLYHVKNHPELIWQEFCDSLTAFNAQKKGSFHGKGSINRDITALIFDYIGRSSQLKTHLVENIGPSDMVTMKLNMLKLEVVVRNWLAGSTAKKFNIPEGTPLEAPLVEFYYKDDALGDPFISDEQAMMLKVVKHRSELDEAKAAGLEVNKWLKTFFAAVGVDLIDFKIELGFDEKRRLILADEISPDSCRLWDQKTGDKLDKDRFRRDLGGVSEAYEKILSLIQAKWGNK